MDHETIQRLINTGMAWRMEGSIGRACMAALKAGTVMCGTEGKRDFWGNYIPSRYEVEAGTKGSFDYVVDAMGMEWAQKMADVDDDAMAISFSD